MLVVYHVHLGCPTALETQGMLAIFFLDFLAFFVDMILGKFWVDYFPGVSGPESRPTFVAHRFDAGGVGTGPTLLRAGHSNPC